MTNVHQVNIGFDHENKVKEVLMSDPYWVSIKNDSELSTNIYKLLRVNCCYVHPLSK